MSISCEKSKVVVRLWACTVEQGAAKERSDMEKLSTLHDLIEERFSDVEVCAENWFRVKGGEIVEQYGDNEYQAWDGVE